MAPWSTLKLGRPSEKDLRGRHSMDPGHRPEADEPPPLSASDGASSTTTTPRRRNHRIRDSVVSLGSVRDPPPALDQLATAGVPLLELPEEAPQRPHRFSLMRFRHASDSQLNKTAQTQSSAPPVPGKR